MELLAALFVGWIIWQVLKALGSSGGSSGVNVEVSYDTGSYSGRSRSRHRSHDDAYDDSRRVWVPPGEPVTVDGRTIADGMVYVGRKLPALSRYHDADPALIKPKLRADSQRPDRSGEYLEYWPSYDSIPRSSRPAYLDWLADGRREPGTPTRYVKALFICVVLAPLFLFGCTDQQAASDIVDRLSGRIPEVQYTHQRQSSDDWKPHGFGNFLRETDPDQLLFRGVRPDTINHLYFSVTVTDRWFSLQCWERHRLIRLLQTLGEDYGAARVKLLDRTDLWVTNFQHPNWEIYGCPNRDYVFP